MKKILVLLLVVSAYASAQTPPKFTKVNYAYNYVGYSSDSNSFVPRYSGFPTNRFGQFGAGQLAVDTTNNIFYFYSGGSWRAPTSQWTTVSSDIYYNSGGAAIGNSSVNSKAILDLVSTSKGMLVPRMNTGQQNAIASPPNGLIIYNTDSAALCYYNGSAWRKIIGGGNPTINYVNQSLRLSTAKDSITFEDYVNAKTFNAVGDGATNDLTAISNAAANALANSKSLFMPKGIYKVVGKLNLSGVHIKFAPGAYIKGGGSLTDTIQNMVADASAYQKIFDTTITVRQLRPAGGAISACWFGAVGDCDPNSEVGTTDNYLPFKRALTSMFDSLPTGTGYFYTKKLYIPAAPKAFSYYISNTLYIGGQIEIYGDGVSGTLLNWPRGVPGLVITNTSYGNTAALANPQGQAAYRFVMHDLTISGYKAALGFFAGYYDAVSHGITLYAGSANLQRLQVENWRGDGVRIYGANENYMADVETDYCAGNGFNFLTPDGNANALYRCIARWSGKYGFNDISFLGNFAFNCNSTTNGGHYSFNRTAITDGGKFWYAKRNVVWRVYHNGHHYTCILAHTANEVDAEPGVGAAWHTYWTDNGVGVYNNQWINWEPYDKYNVGFVRPGVTSGWQTYYDSTIDFSWANNVWNDSTQYVGGGGYYMEGANQTGMWTGLYSEFDQITGYNNSASYVAFGNGGTVILGQDQNGWSQKWAGGYMSFQNIAVLTQNTQDRVNSERWWAVINGPYPQGGSQKVFGWYNSQGGGTHGWSYDTTGNNIGVSNINAVSIGKLYTSDSIVASGLYSGLGKIRLRNISTDWNETAPGTGTGSIQLDASNVDGQGSAVTFSAYNQPGTAQAGVYVRSGGAFGTKMYLATTDNFTTGAQTRLFINHIGKISLGPTPNFSPTAYLHLPAGLTTAANAPLKLTTASSALLTTPETGAIEVDTTQLYYSAGIGANLKRAMVAEWGYTSTAVDYTALLRDYTIEETVANKTVTLPTAVGITGKVYIIKLSAATGVCTVATTSSQTIDGVTTYTISGQYASVSVQSNGSNWNILATSEPTGTYNPTLTNVTNVTGSTSYSTTKWEKHGNMVDVFGKFQVDPTAAAATEVDISLPIASNLTGDDDVAGIGSSLNITGEVLTILADATNDRAQVKWNATDVTNRTVYFHFSYIIK